MANEPSRRDFLKAVGAGAAVVAASGSAGAAVGAGMPMRALGKTGVKVSLLGLGGYHLGLLPEVAAATRIVHEALDHGVTFMDNAWEYHDGKSERWMGEALKGRRDKVFLMTKVCSHGRDKKVALQQLDESLKRLQTDHLDLWQIHEVVYDNDPDLCFAPGGAVEALVQAKKDGKVRFVGFTGHKDPAIHLKMLARDFAFDACQLPLNCFDGTFRSFERAVVPELARRGIAAIGMKSLGGRGDAVKQGVVKVDEALRYAMSLPAATVVSGIDSPEVLRQNLAIATAFKPMTPAEMEALRRRCAPLAADGRYELFKVSKHFDGPPGRAQHGFPPPDKAPL